MNLYPSYSTYTTANSGSTNVTATCLLPSGTVAGNLLIAEVVTTNGTVLTPTGWTATISDPAGPEAPFYVFTKVAGASEPSTYNFTSSSNGIGVNIFLITNNDTSAPIAGSGFTNTGTNSSTITANAITPTSTNTLLLFLGVAGGGVSSFSGATSWTQVNSSGNAGFMGYGLYGPASSTGTVTGTQTGGSPSTGALIAIKPATQYQTIFNSQFTFLGVSLNNTIVAGVFGAVFSTLPATVTFSTYLWKNVVKPLAASFVNAIKP